MPARLHLMQLHLGRPQLRRHLPVLLLLASFLIGPLGCIQVELFGGRAGPLVETEIYGAGGPKILMIEIEGIIRQDSTSSFFNSTESTVARVREQLDAARADDDVRAILLRVDTPGGSYRASVRTSG